MPHQRNRRVCAVRPVRVEGAGDPGRTSCVSFLSPSIAGVSFRRLGSFWRFLPLFPFLSLFSILTLPATAFIFKQRTVATIFITTFMSGATILVQLYYLPQLFQVVQGVSPIRSGILILPQLVTTTAFVFVSGQLVSRTGEYKPMICAGYAIWTVGLGLLSTLDENSSTVRAVFSTPSGHIQSPGKRLCMRLCRFQPSSTFRFPIPTSTDLYSALRPRLSATSY
jgi:hypothetical protein